MQHTCGFDDHDGARRADYAAFASALDAKARQKSTFGQPGGWVTRTISVIVHDIVSPGDTPLTTKQVEDQIDILSQACDPTTIDCRLPKEYDPYFGHLQVRFSLKGAPILSRTSKRKFVMDDPEILDPNAGRAVSDPHHFVNVYVCNLGADLAGYAQSPDAGAADPAKDAIVVNRTAFGIDGAVNANTNEGKTLIHEVGHYFGLFHVDGDGLNAYNYMHTDADEYMLIFTSEQVAWMQYQIEQYRAQLGEDT